MVLCDRCKKELSSQERASDGVHMSRYQNARCFEGEYVDLCFDCKRLRTEFLAKIESYFMVNEDPMKILEGKVYWRQDI